MYVCELVPNDFADNYFHLLLNYIIYAAHQLLFKERSLKNLYWYLEEQMHCSACSAFNLMCKPLHESGGHCKSATHTNHCLSKRHCCWLAAGWINSKSLHTLYIYSFHSLITVPPFLCKMAVFLALRRKQKLLMESPNYLF